MIAIQEQTINNAIVPIYKIKNYDDIYIDTINSNTLIVFDIDETIIKFPGINQKWWDDNYNYHYTLYDINNARQKVFNQWLEIIHNYEPIMLDKIKFNTIMDKINSVNSKIVFLTARPPELREITEKNLDSCNIKYNKEDIYFLPNKSETKNKGEMIIKIIQQLNHINDIIFVDDVIHNVQSVINEFAKKNLFDYNLQLYLMDHENLD